MLFSYNWLKTYFDKELPAPTDVEQGIIFHSFEVEGMEIKGDDSLLEIKILPDRNHDCLCHTGVAGEVSAIFSLPKRAFSADYGEIKTAFSNQKPARSLAVKIDAPDLCYRYVGRMVENIAVGESPTWLKERLANIGQRSINNIVDATNYVMFDLGQPMHAFDADKVKGGITIRRAKAGEIMQTLDDKELCLTENQLVIADDEGVLALAGIKGGKKAELDAQTKNIILESANFNAVNVRRTSQALGIRTDASKRFENSLSPEVAGQAMDYLTSLIYDLAGKDDLKIGESVDEYPTPAKQTVIIVSPEEINAKLGIVVPTEEMIAILKRLDIVVEQDNSKLKLTIPFRRVDLEETVNIVEEIGRLYGYDKIEPKLLEAKIDRTEIREGEKRYRIANKIREILVGQGFAEVYGYTLTEKGEVELANPLANDKPFLRSNLSDWLAEKLAFNLQYVLFDDEPVKIFEIGRVFKKDSGNISETTTLALGVAGKAKKFRAEEIIALAKKELMEVFGEDIAEISNRNLPEIKGGVVEISFDKIAEMARDFTPADLDKYISSATYQKVSLFPRVIRDVALWVPENVAEEEVIKTIKDNAGELLVIGPVQFDRFAKDERVSLAFRQVFQSYEKTLSDEEVNAIMEKIISALEAKNWEVRK